MLVFVPIITSHTFASLPTLLAGVIMFVAWSLVASGVYLSNDILDLPADRSHPRKCRRPFASGRLPLAVGIFASPLFVLTGIGITLLISWQAAALLAFYALVSLSYSLYYKRCVLIDVFILAFLYTCRVVGGGIATDNPVSIWLMGFSCFFFLGLAFLKRSAELTWKRDSNDHGSGNRGYRFEDLEIIKLFGVASGFASVIILSLYVRSNVATAMYARPSVIWVIVPLLLFWQCRLWIVTCRGQMHDDPILFSIKDRASWWVAACIAAAFVVSVVRI